jgi:hypothetical protein
MAQSADSEAPPADPVADTDTTDAVSTADVLWASSITRSDLPCPTDPYFGRAQNIPRQI